jgi:hypothetical protein
MSSFIHRMPLATRDAAAAPTDCDQSTPYREAAMPPEIV